MSKVSRVRSILLLSLVIGCLIIFANFIFISCGKDPQLKVADSNRGQFALDFSLAPAEIGKATAVNSNFPSIEGKELTIEAWVKNKSDDLNGGIFGHIQAKGIGMYVKDNEVRMVIRRDPLVLGDPEGGEPRCNGNPTSTECILESGFNLQKDVWTHIAGVLVNEDHTDVHPPCSSGDGAEAEKPHMDIYINGEFVDCATTESRFTKAEPSGINLTIGYLDVGVGDEIDETINSSTRFDGVIDEVRFWGVARTQAQIKACMNQELSISTPGDCYIDPSILLGYWRLNEGQGSQIFDISGNGNSGVIEIPGQDGSEPWSTGWTEGVPTLTRDPGY